MPKQQQDDEFSDMQEVKSNYIKWGKVGDFVKGTLTTKRRVPDKLKEQDKPGAMQWMYEIQIAAGRFHHIKEDKSVEETSIELTAGNFIVVGGKPGIDDGMRNVKLGQIVGFRFTEVKPSKRKGFSPTKVIKVYAGAMDPNYMGQSADEQAVAESGI